MLSPCTPAFHQVMLSVRLLHKLLGKFCIWLSLIRTTAKSCLQEGWDRVELTTVYILDDWSFFLGHHLAGSICGPGLYLRNYLMLGSDS